MESGFLLGRRGLDGLRADFVVLDRDPLAVPGSELDDLKVLSTWIDGQPVYGAGAATGG